MATMRLASGDATTLDALQSDARVSALATASSAVAAHSNLQQTIAESCALLEQRISCPKLAFARCAIASNGLLGHSSEGMR
jgi:hypothetical protein